MGDFIGGIFGGAILLPLIVIVFAPNAIIGAVLADIKGRSTVGWFILCIIFPFYGLIIIAGLPEINHKRSSYVNRASTPTVDLSTVAPLTHSEGRKKKCVKCKAEVDENVYKCPKCGAEEFI